MTHDPLCPHTSVSPDVCTLCTLIARVREDERGYAKQTSAAVMAYGEGKRDGYTAALRDAVEAVRERKDGFIMAVGAESNPSEQYWITRAAAIEAIEALRGTE